MELISIPQVLQPRSNLNENVYYVVKPGGIKILKVNNDEVRQPVNLG